MEERAKFAEHGNSCAHLLDEQAACSCYLSVDAKLLAATSIFEPATTEGPSDVLGKFDEFDRAVIHDFVSKEREKRKMVVQPQDTVSELYVSLAPGEVRVLELLAAPPGEPLQGQLHVVSIDFSHPLQDNKYRRHTNHAVSLATGKPFWYTALSYVWGPPVFDRDIHIGDSQLKITTSLAGALDRLRSPEHSIYLWIDQICINQQNVREKEKQIPLMDKIYTKATNTVIWLGDDNGEEPHLAFETMQIIYARLQLSDIEITPNDFARLDFPSVDDPSWSAIRKLFLRPWFTRLWTIQEAILSRNLFLQCGDAVACWDDVAAWCYVLEHCNLFRWLTGSVDNVSKASENQFRQLSGGYVLNSLQADRLQDMMLEAKEYLLNSLVRTRYAQSTEPKDKVYGVLGIAESSIVPDYSKNKTARQVFQEACLTQMPHLTYEILSCVDHEQPLKPSWVPDWSSPRVTESFGYSTKALALYFAGGKLQSRPSGLLKSVFKDIVSEDEEELTLSGICFDTIQHLGPVSEDPQLDIDNPQSGNPSLVQYVELIKKNYTKNGYPSSNASIYDAFWTTLLAGRDGSGTAAPTQEHSEVFSLILDSTVGQMPSLPGQTYSPRRKKGFFTLDSLRTRKPAKTLADLRTTMRSSLTMRRFAITQGGFFALVPRGAIQGDEIVVFKGACVPFVIRKVGDAGSQRRYELLGEAYVHGIMQGEVMNMHNLSFEGVTLV